MDFERYRATSLDQWENAAAGWAARALRLQANVAPMSHWMIEAVHLQPGQTILELAAGPGETGFLAAELIRPGGTLVSTDFAEAMVQAARERARELGIENAEFRRMDAESLDLPAASVDGVLCRMGYMLMADPGAALRETRRVLRPLGRVALAAWARPEDNPWVSIPAQEIRRAAGAPEPDPDEPGMFAFADPSRVETELSDAGFTDIVVEPLDLRFAYESFDEWLAVSRDLGRPMAELLDSLEPQMAEEVIGTVRERLRPYATPDGQLDIPARAMMAAATA